MRAVDALVSSERLLAGLSGVKPRLATATPVASEEFVRPEISELAIKPPLLVSTTVDTPVCPTGRPAVNALPVVVPHCGTYPTVVLPGPEMPGTKSEHGIFRVPPP